MKINPELSNSKYESEETTESSPDQMGGHFDKTAAEEARAKRIAEYEEAHPDAVKDIEKARAMAEAGKEYEIKAIEQLKLAAEHRRKAEEKERKARNEGDPELSAILADSVKHHNTMAEIAEVLAEAAQLSATWREDAAGKDYDEQKAKENPNEGNDWRTDTEEDDAISDQHPTKTEEAESKVGEEHDAVNERATATEDTKSAEDYEKNAAHWYAMSEASLRAAEALETEVQYNSSRDGVHRQWAEEDFSRAAKDRERAERYRRMGDEAMEKAKKLRELSESSNQQEDTMEDYVTGNHDFAKDQDDDTLPEYMRPENKEKYDEALKQIDPAVVRKIMDTLSALVRLVGKEDYDRIMHVINNNILSGKYKNAKIDEGLGGMIRGVE